MNPVPSDILTQVLNEASRFSVDPAMVLAIADWETRGSFNRNAKGSSGEIGLMQILPSTGAAMGYSLADLSNLSTNIEAGTRYIKQGMGYYSAPEDVISFYNSGKAFNKAPSSTRNSYVPSVLQKYAEYSIYLHNAANLPAREPSKPTGAMFAGFFSDPFNLAIAAVIFLFITKED